MNEKQVPFRYNVGVRSSDFEEAKAFINTHIEDREISPLSSSGRAENLLTLQPLGSSSLFGAVWSEKVHIQSETQKTFHAVLVLSGNIFCKSLDTNVPANSLVLTAPGKQADLVWGKGTRAVVMSLARQKLIDTLGVSDIGLLRQTNSVIPGTHQDALLLRNGISCLAQQHDICEGQISPSVQAQWEGLLLAQFANQLHREGEESPPILPGRIRLAMEWIRAHIHQPMSVCDLLLVTGASRRSLESGFRTYLNTTPARFILCHKLKGARELLRSAPDMSVGDAAFSFGFSHLSHFTRQYQDAFGELPSETLRQCRESRVVVSKKARLDSA